MSAHSINFPPPSTVHHSKANVLLASISATLPIDQNPAYQDHAAALQHELSVYEVTLSCFRSENDKLLAAFSRSQTLSEALKRKLDVSDTEIISLTEEKLRLQAQVIELERDVEELSRSRDEFRQAAVHEGSQYVEIVKKAAKLEEIAAEERKVFKRTLSQFVGGDVDMEDIIDVKAELADPNDAKPGGRRLRRKVDGEGLLGTKDLPAITPKLDGEGLDPKMDLVMRSIEGCEDEDGAEPDVAETMPMPLSGSSYCTEKEQDHSIISSAPTELPTGHPLSPSQPRMSPGKPRHSRSQTRTSTPVKDGKKVKQLKYSSKFEPTPGWKVSLTLICVSISTFFVEQANGS
jgi:hypothetical protein